MTLYDTLPLKEFEHFCRLSGLEDCCDVKALDSLLQDASTVLEIGAGYGRVVKHILLNYSCDLAALESSPVCQRYLERLPCRLIRQSVLQPLQDTFDLGLWLWTGILDLTFEDQESAMNNLLRSCKKVIVDIPGKDINHQSKSSSVPEGDIWTMQTSFGSHTGYLPTDNRLQRYGLVETVIPYVTQTQRHRSLYVYAGNNL